MRSPVYLAIARLASTKEISEEDIIEALENSLVAAYKKDFNTEQDVRVEFNTETGEFKIFIPFIMIPGNKKCHVVKDILA